MFTRDAIKIPKSAFKKIVPLRFKLSKNDSNLNAEEFESMIFSKVRRTYRIPRPIPPILHSSYTGKGGKVEPIVDGYEVTKSGARRLLEIKKGFTWVPTGSGGTLPYVGTSKEQLFKLSRGVRLNEGNGYEYLPGEMWVFSREANQNKKNQSFWWNLYKIKPETIKFLHSRWDNDNYMYRLRNAIRT